MKEIFHQFFKKYLDKKLGKHEVLELMDFIRSKATNEYLEKIMLEAWNNTPETTVFNQEKSEELFNRIIAAAKK
jgi:molybdenum cofactor biosynthesis enzyme MoaA